MDKSLQYLKISLLGFKDNFNQLCDKSTDINIREMVSLNNSIIDYIEKRVSSNEIRNLAKGLTIIEYKNYNNILRRILIASFKIIRRNGYSLLDIMNDFDISLYPKKDAYISKIVIEAKKNLSTFELMIQSIK